MSHSARKGPLPGIVTVPWHCTSERVWSKVSCGACMVPFHTTTIIKTTNSLLKCCRMPCRHLSGVSLWCHKLLRASAEGFWVKCQSWRCFKTRVPLKAWQGLDCTIRAEFAPCQLPVNKSQRGKSWSFITWSMGLCWFWHHTGEALAPPFSGFEDVHRSLQRLDRVQSGTFWRVSIVVTVQLLGRQINGGAH